MRIPFFSTARSREADARARLMSAIASNVETRSFNAAMVDRLVADWQWDGGFTNTEVLGAMPALRARSREMAKNSPIYARYIQLLRENVVGSGFRFKALPYNGDRADEIDHDTARFIEYHWWKWSKNPYLVDVGRRQNLTQFLALAVECWVRDGEAFIILDEAAQNRYGISLRLVRSDCIDETVNKSIDENTVVRGGVEYDMTTGAPLAYYFNGNRIDQGGTLFMAGKPRIRIPARFVIHLFERHDPGQVRGIPLGYSALLQLKMLEEYTKAELVAAKDEACTVGAFSCPAGQDGPAQMDGATANEFRSKVAAGQKLFLPEGWSYNSTTPQHPNRGWAEFSTGLQRMISTGLGVDFSELTGNGSDTISAVARQSMLRTREMYRDRQMTVQSLVLDPIYFAWLHSFLRLRVSGELSDEQDFQRLADHEFQGRRWGWIDPAAEVNAATVATAHGWRTDAEVAAEYGNDIDDNLLEAARVKPLKEAAGLITVGQGLNAKAPEPSGDAGEIDGSAESKGQAKKAKPKKEK